MDNKLAVNTILIIDEDKVHMDYYRIQLEMRGFDVTICPDPQNAFKLLEGASEKFSVIVCDLMMPATGVYEDSETAHGLLTGLKLALDIRKKYSKAPIMILTNMNMPTYLNEVQEAIAGHKDIFFAKKSDMGPTELAVGLEAILTTGKLDDAATQNLKKFWDSLLLKPSIFGIGIDLKKIFER